MLKPLAAASVLLFVFSIEANARPNHRHHGHRAHGWCGSYLSKYLGKPDRRLALARSWASENMNAGGPEFGVVVVWPHHVGIITGKPRRPVIVDSGNDGGAVRTRARSLAADCIQARVIRNFRLHDPGIGDVPRPAMQSPTVDPNCRASNNID